MRSPSSLLFFGPVVLAAGVSFSQGGCAAFADLPEYKLASGGGGQGGSVGGFAALGGRGGTSEAGGGGASVGGNGAGRGGDAGGTGGTAAGGGGTPPGAGAAGEGAAGGFPNGGAGGSGGGAVATGGDGGASGSIGTAGKGGVAASAGSSGNGGVTAGGVGGSAGTDAGQSGAAGAGAAGASGEAGAAGTTAGASGAGGSPTGGNAGEGGQAGSPTAFPPEILAEAQSDPRTILIEEGVVYWLNRDFDGANGAVRSLPRPSPATVVSPAAAASPVQNVAAAKDIVFLSGRLFVLRGAGDAPQPILTSYSPTGGGAEVIQNCTDGDQLALDLGVCNIVGLHRLAASATTLYFTGEATGSTNRKESFKGTRACTTTAGSCETVVTEAPSRAIASDGVDLFSVDASNPKNIKKVVGKTVSGLGPFSDEVLDLATLGNEVFALLKGGGVSAVPKAGGTVRVLTDAGTVSNPQHIVASNGFLYFTALGTGGGTGSVSRMRPDGTELEVLSGDRSGPRFLVVDTSAGRPHVYFTDISTVQRIRLP